MDIRLFRDEYFFLSNFYKIPIFYDYKTWDTVEHLFQAAKFTDSKDREAIKNCETPGQAKRLARTLQLRPDWEDKKQEIMCKCLKMKFDQNPSLKEKLIDTENAVLVEGNSWHDNYWGECSCKKCEKIFGKNILGELLMQIRKEYLIERGLIKGDKKYGSTTILP